ncbi:formimidoylglutamase [Shewanella sp. GXUN23E]|uniref:formimidoylglutamase n=1 Tax=Shewanella sp. GXUN23E TaxID=3422498 RepID=UPI003D7D15FB
MDLLTLCSPAYLNALLSTRPGETKLGQNLQLLDQFSAQALLQAKANGARFALLGISEDIGPRANLGQGGADDSFAPAIRYFGNLQANRFFDGRQCLLVGDIRLPNSETSLDSLRDSVARLDEAVTEVITALLNAGLEPVVIGGGHNNAFGLLRALAQSHGAGVAAVNLDPHCDFRPLEGRHSGNGFSYAANQGYLSRYHVLGLHEQKNSEASLAQLEAFGGSWHSFQDIWVRRRITLQQALNDISAVNQSLPLGLELDLDAISELPSSAITFAGVPLLDACHYVSVMASQCPCHYLHLAESAPARHPAGVDAGRRVTGQAIAELLLAYMSARP